MSTRMNQPRYDRKLKIAQIAPLMESVPPRLYGGTERIVSYLSEELSRLGHHVTLFASGDSITSSLLVSCTPSALRLCSNILDPVPYYMLMLDRVRDRVEEFDILHFHIDQFHFPVGASFSSIVKLNTYIVDIGTNIAHYREVRDKLVNTSAPPASTAIGVPQLARPEVEAIAVLPPT
jgi:hypothetical protein